MRRSAVSGDNIAGRFRLVGGSRSNSRTGILAWPWLCDVAAVDTAAGEVEGGVDGR